MIRATAQLAAECARLPGRAMRDVAQGNKQSAQALLDAGSAKETVMLSTILTIVLILVLIGALPTWPYSSGWGYGPGGVLGLALVVVLVLALMGRI
jgi:hypothetical protein